MEKIEEWINEGKKLIKRQMYKCSYDTMNVTSRLLHIITDYKDIENLKFIKKTPTYYQHRLDRIIKDLESMKKSCGYEDDIAIKYAITILDEIRNLKPTDENIEKIISTLKEAYHEISSTLFYKSKLEEEIEKL